MIAGVFQREGPQLTALLARIMHRQKVPIDKCIFTGAGTIEAALDVEISSGFIRRMALCAASEP